MLLLKNNQLKLTLMPRRHIWGGDSAPFPSEARIAAISSFPVGLSSPHTELKYVPHGLPPFLMSVFYFIVGASCASQINKVHLKLSVGV